MTHHQGDKPDSIPVRLTTSGVYDLLRTQILDNIIPPGTRVNIDAISRKFGVSPTPVREALRRLQGDNLLVTASNRGYSTTPLLDLAGLRELFEFRLLVEPWAARTAAANRLGNPAHHLNAELQTFTKQAEGQDDIRQHLVTHDSRFHEHILAASGNDVVRYAYEQTHCHLHIFRLYPADMSGKITIEEHRQVWAAIRDCEPAQAENAMHEHLKRAFQRFAKAFDEAGRGKADLSAYLSPRLAINDAQLPA
ncbi:MULTISPECIES: GntR family transcriptional regulator [unclassified Cryobacterium]|uniref:GntR family transcriptional regulator n=1 Tax=unclassified Cryobacterium TaxID=2649013 RepID=UPI001069121A|nr:MULTISPECIES: GntR family transcriptional regulator [unclassified Cryobacterium]TFD05105.1 GntR family transcriptional regulator [Cryobacterium sp. TMT1-66-1]TFD09769.1 GntR family transcriptional regulator [Cryobacterium sp. TMT1-2-2]